VLAQDARITEARTNRVTKKVFFIVFSLVDGFGGGSGLNGLHMVQGNTVRGQFISFFKEFTRHVKERLW
jgi:hypothetical protein